MGARHALRDVFSCTKAVTATATLRVARETGAGWDEPVTAWWPEYAVAGKETTTLADMLTHQAGLPAFDRPVTAEQAAEPAAMAALLARQHPVWEPATRHGYHALTFGWLAGEFIRRHAGCTVGDYTRRRPAPAPPARQASPSPAPPAQPSAHLPSRPPSSRAITRAGRTPGGYTPGPGAPGQPGKRRQRGPSVAVRETADVAHRPRRRAPPVRHTSVDTATQRSAALQDDTRRDRAETAPQRENSQLAAVSAGGGR